MSHDQEFHPLKVALIAIGTEITSGEIVNSNAATVASWLTDLGFVCDLQLTVPDDRPLMHWTIAEATKSHGIVITTGGLGPTTDDFTRDVIADAARKPLEWNEEVWKQIETRLLSVGAPLASSNKQQAYFPKGATVYPNNHGTASAFSLTLGRSKIFALPGPPSEIAGLWRDHLNNIFSALAPPERNQKPLRWRCLGQSESKLGELVEEALAGSQLLTGYRSHIPYIDVKVWVPNDRKTEFEAQWQPKLDLVLKPWLVGRGDDDAARSFYLLTKNISPLVVIDSATGGKFATRFFAAAIDQSTSTSILTSSQQANSALTASLSDSLSATVSVVKITCNVNTGAWELTLRGDKKGLIKDQDYYETSRYKGILHADRFRSYICERTMLLLTAWLS